MNYSINKLFIYYWELHKYTLNQKQPNIHLNIAFIYGKFVFYKLSWNSVLLHLPYLTGPLPWWMSLLYVHMWVWYVRVCLSMCASGLSIRAPASCPWPGEGHSTAKLCVWCVSAHCWRLMSHRVRCWGRSDHRNSLGRWEDCLRWGEHSTNETSQPESGSFTGHPAERWFCTGFNKVLMAYCKWHMIQNTTEPLVDHTHPAGLSNIGQLLKST